MKKQYDVKDEKTFAIVKENVELKSIISELKEQLIKKTHVIEAMNSEIKIMLNDMKYLHQKLNHGEGIDAKEEEVTAKFIFSLMDNLIDEKHLNNKDSNDKNSLLEERVTGLKN